MPSIIPTLTRPSVAPNVTATITPQSMTIGADAVYFATAQIGRLFYNYTINGFNNAGVLWNESSPEGASVLAGFYVYGVVNSGTMVVNSASGNAYGISMGSGGDYITNSGALYAMTGMGNAYGITTYESWHRITNSGTIAAQARGEGGGGVGDAVAIAAFNGAQIINHQGGSILGEGIYGRAILMGRASEFGDASAQIVNHGLIAAATLTGAHQSIAITFHYLGGQSARIENDGVIRADVAIETNETSWNPFTRGGATIHNLAGGRIEGRLDLLAGDDLIVNAGTIVGNVSTGTGRDVFDTASGSWTGTADLGWEEDLFLGSVAGDVVRGNRGGDALYGNDGNDLLLGGTGDDLVVGGAGNDGLYGESGRDRILTQGGDAAFGGDGDDVVVAGDLSFARIDGGAGDDVLEIDQAGLRLDLAAALASGRLTGIETIALAGDQQVAVGAGDAATLSGGTLTFTGGAADAVLLVGAWVVGTDVVRGGVSFRSFTLNGETVLVQAGIATTTGATPGAGFSGLIPIASGDAAPVGGTIPGGELMSAVQTDVRILDSRGTVVVDADETWSNTDLSFIYGYGSARLVNHGNLIATANPGNAFTGVGGNDFSEIINTGTIRVTGTGSAYITTVGPMSSGPLVNSGVIEAIGDQGQATAVTSGARSSGTEFHNSGTISASSNGAAFGVRLIGLHTDPEGRSGTNAGAISATGGSGTIGLQVYIGGLFVNEGTITARNVAGSGVSDAIGVTLYNSSMLATTFENRGTITGPIGVQGTGGASSLLNYGRIEGSVALFNEADLFRNTGTVTGSITLGGGNDYYDGSAAQQASTIAGGDGDDVLIGRSGDTLGGGAGRDYFRFAGPGTGTIDDFASGSDMLDLSGIAPDSVTLTAGSGGTTVTATSATGTLTLWVRGTITQSDIITAPRPGTAAVDTLVASTSGSIVEGLGGNDLIVGLAGDDRIDGGTGNDLMIGGAGDDIYFVDSEIDVVREFEGEGYDTIVITNPTQVYYYRLPSHVERMIGGSGRGNALDNIMIGSDGADNLSGGDGGSDSLYGGRGDDLYYVNGQDDIVFENAGEGVDTVVSDNSYYLYANIEGLRIGGRDGSFGVGNALDNQITGSAYANLLLGGAGNDVISGGMGNDMIYGEDGDDVIFGDTEIDYIVGGAGNDVINGGFGADAIYGGDGDDILWGDVQGDGSGASAQIADFNTDILVGGAGNDILRGDTLRGDYDLMDGGAGDDSYYVDTPDDLTFEATDGGTDTVYATINGAGYYLYANVENLVLGGNTPFGVGNELDNRITGNWMSNWLLGGAGDDVLNGRGGNDVLFGEAGADIFVFERGTGGDVIGDFVAGTDRIDLSAFGFTSFAQVEAALGENGGTSFLALGNGDMIVLNGVARASLSAGDFVLAAVAEDKVPVMEELDRGLLGGLMHDFHNPRLFVDFV